MKNISLRCIIKIPDNITVLYSEKRHHLVIIGTLTRKSKELKTKIHVDKSNRTITVYPLPFDTKKITRKNDLKAIQRTTVALIKQLFIETSVTLYQRLNLVGVGYRVFEVEDFKNELLLFRLGFSHPIYFRIQDDLKVSCLKSTTLFVSGNSYVTVKQTAAQIRANKLPECYKGKGILHENEKIILKEGKKV